MKKQGESIMSLGRYKVAETILKAAITNERFCIEGSSMSGSIEKLFRTDINGEVFERNSLNQYLIKNNPETIEAVEDLSSCISIKKKYSVCYENYSLAGNRRGNIVPILAPLCCLEVYSTDELAFDLLTAKGLIERLCGMNKLLQHMLNENYKQSKDNIYAMRTLKCALEGKPANSFLCCNQSKSGRTTYDFVTLHEAGKFDKIGTSKVSIERAFFNFLANSLGVDYFNKCFYIQDFFNDYLSFLGLMLVDKGNGFYFIKAINN